jgi:hypothetical protein
LRTRRLKKGLKEHKEDEKLADAEPATGMKHESFPDRKESVKSSHAPDILEDRETRKDSLETEEKEKQTPAVQQGIASQTEQGWPKSWTERVEAVRLHRPSGGYRRGTDSGNLWQVLIACTSSIPRVEVLIVNTVFFFHLLLASFVYLSVMLQGV